MTEKSCDFDYLAFIFRDLAQRTVVEKGVLLLRQGLCGEMHVVLGPNMESGWGGRKKSLGSLGERLRSPAWEVKGRREQGHCKECCCGRIRAFLMS
jgi:hypothetical protein